MQFMRVATSRQICASSKEFTEFQRNNIKNNFVTYVTYVCWAVDVSVYAPYYGISHDTRCEQARSRITPIGGRLKILGAID